MSEKIIFSGSCSVDEHRVLKCAINKDKISHPPHYRVGNKTSCQFSMTINVNISIQ